MNATIIANTDELTHDEWLDARRKGIGGSDAAAIAGLSPYKSAFAVFLEKTGQVNDSAEGHLGNAREWGRRLEDFVAERFVDDTGIKVARFPYLVQSIDRPWQLANLDRAVLDDQGQPVIPIECKTTSAWKADDWRDEPPDYAAIQTIHYLDVTGAEQAHIAALIGGQEYRSYLVKRDEELIAHLRTIEAAFWQQVLDGVPPLPTGLDKDLLSHLYEVKPDAVIELDRGHVEPLLRAHAEAAERKKAAEKECAAVEAQLQALLGEHEIGTVDGRPVVTWKQHERKGYSVAASTYRSLLVKGIKE